MSQNTFGQVFKPSTYNACGGRTGVSYGQVCGRKHKSQQPIVEDSPPKAKLYIAVDERHLFETSEDAARFIGCSKTAVNIALGRGDAECEGHSIGLREIRSVD